MFMDSYPNGKRGNGRWGIINNKPLLVFYLATEWPREKEVVLPFDVYNPLLPVNINAEHVSIAFIPESTDRCLR